MARMSLSTNLVTRRRKLRAIKLMFSLIMRVVNYFFILISHATTQVIIERPRAYVVNQMAKMLKVRDWVYHSDRTSIDEIRMNRLAFGNLCSMLETIGGLKHTNNMLIDEQVAMFLHIIAHHVKNRVVKVDFKSSGETISRHFNNVLKAVNRLHGELLKKPKPVPENSTDARWKWFKNCLGAVDGTHIGVRVPIKDKPRYRNRKGDISTNVMIACDQDLEVICVFPGWEGSAADGRVLRDAISRPNGFKVPHGFYYLVDAGYANSEGFLAPFRGQRYHLNDWRQGHQPQTPREYFNYKHSSARNVVERCIGLLKSRWAILRSPSWYPIKTHNRIIIACCLLHNFIRRQMGEDPMENSIQEDGNVDDEGDGDGDDDLIQSIDISDAWTTWREQLANEMFTSWNATRNE